MEGEVTQGTTRLPSNACTIRGHRSQLQRSNLPRQQMNKPRLRGGIALCEVTPCVCRWQSQGEPKLLSQAQIPLTSGSELGPV